MDSIKEIGKLEKMLTTKMDSSLYKKKASVWEDTEESFMYGGANVIDISKEYGLLLYYENYTNKNKITNLLSFVHGSLENGQWAFLNLEEVQNSMNQHFKYLFLKKRYTDIFAQAKSILSYDHSGFHINEFVFETLDEVEKALANKMFL